MYIDIMYIYICIIYNIYVHINVKVDYGINRIHEKAFRSDLSAQIEKPSSLSNYILQNIFSCYLFVLGNFVTFLGIAVNLS